MASPRPVPPYLRVVDASACEKDWKSLLMLSDVKTNACIAHGEGEDEFFLSVSVPIPLAGDSENHLALFCEFDRVAEQVGDDLPQTGGISHDGWRNFAFEKIGDVDAFFNGAGGDQVERDSTQSRRSSGRASRSMRPASIFEKSRMSLMMESSASLELRMVST
jgi:hypothetical protein